MKVENPAALRFILQEDVFLTEADKLLLSAKEPVVTEPLPAPAPQPEPVIETQKAPVKYLGNNNKKFLVLAHYPVDDFMTNAHLNALQSTLGRKGLATDDVALVNMARSVDATLADLQSQLSPQKILVLGKEALPAGLNAPAFNSPQTHGTVAVLLTYSFGEMMTNNDNKKAFWEQVKNF